MGQRLYEGTLVEASKLARSFGTGKREVAVLCGVDLSVQAGELVALFGPSGSGKTTLLNLIGALDRPTGGSVHFRDMDITALSDHKRSALRRQQFGFVFQNYTLMPIYTAAENIDLILRLPGLGLFERRRRVKSTLEAVGLSAWANHLPGQLSGGQQQRVAIARAIANDPPLVVGDEPTGNLDRMSAETVFEIFHDLRRQGRTVIVVTHDRALARSAPQVMTLADGLIKTPARERRST
jgi:ABC-type lipoprotein export system ATPase subunit